MTALSLDVLVGQTLPAAFCRIAVDVRKAPKADLIPMS
jgi:hypothetical protein